MLKTSRRSHYAPLTLSLGRSGVVTTALWQAQMGAIILSVGLTRKPAIPKNSEIGFASCSHRGLNALFYASYFTATCLAVIEFYVTFAIQERTGSSVNAIVRWTAIPVFTLLINNISKSKTMDNNNQKEQQTGLGFAAPGVALGEYSNMALVTN